MSRLRKLQKIEGQRRSPRISALEAEAHGHSISQGPAFRTRGRKNTKLRPLQLLTPSPNQVVEHSRHRDIQKKCGGDKPSKLPSFLPEKRILQLVLDTLQRRDTYEIFAEPVDQNEVEDYYAIIKEPMDFGTMRAKLHEGMYMNLEQFERDVFLIFDNAMQFNSSGTIYFRQARVINELAKKVFDLLKNNPEKFELEFSETRRKIGRKNQGDFRDTTDLKTSEIVIGVPSKTSPCSSRGRSNRKNFKTKHGCSDITKRIDARDVESIAGGNSSCRSFEIDRRCTYRPLSLEKDTSIFSTVYGKLKLLEQVNQKDIGYKDSLMLFVRDLGPTAQNIGKRKLLGCEIRTASTSVPCIPVTSNTVTTSAAISHYRLDQYPGYSNEIRCPPERISGREKVEGTLNVEKEKGCSPLDGNTLACHKWKWSLRGDKGFPNKSFCFHSCPSRAGAEDFTCLDKGSKETGYKFGRMLLERSKMASHENLSVPVLENSQASSVIESRLENSCEFQPRPLAMESSDASCLVQDKCQMKNNVRFRSKCVMDDREAVCRTNEISCSSEAKKMLQSDQTVPVASSFVFNLPYLKTRLDQINSSEQYRVEGYMEILAVLELLGFSTFSSKTIIRGAILLEQGSGLRGCCQFWEAGREGGSRLATAQGLGGVRVVNLGRLGGRVAREGSGLRGWCQCGEARRKGGDAIHQRSRWRRFREARREGGGVTHRWHRFGEAKREDGGATPDARLFGGVDLERLRVTVEVRLPTTHDGDFGSLIEVGRENGSRRIRERLRVRDRVPCLCEARRENDSLEGGGEEGSLIRHREGEVSLFR
ncbi:hypothetical protein Fmac_028419 [Flemingia macrophylla]|uniref:Bromo domain-containing protein n=1 Tax=Flemingia macrophylla TaxID=520843 RepID=A0ABD1L7G1_9FABA